MANLQSAIKRVRQSEEKTARNSAKISAVRTAIKKYEAAVENGADNTQELFQNAAKLIDKAKSSGLVHENKANRVKSRLAKLNK